MPSPSGVVDKTQVLALDNKVTFPVQGNIWVTTVADTNSMLPLIDNGDIAVLTDSFNKNELTIGDVVVYHYGSGGTIIHRILKIDETENSKVYTCKGDSNAGKDPYILLDEHILWLLVGVIYCKK